MRRAVALVAAVTAAMSIVAAAPASADALDCHLVLSGPTPAAEVDTNNDGYPEVRVPSVSNVTLCVGADVVLTDSPSFWSEPCSEWGTCTRFLVHYGLSGYAETGVQLCYAVDGSTICSRTRPVRVPLDAVSGGTICFGYDLAGGSPCGNGQLIAFE